MAEENVHEQTSDDILVSLARSGDLDAIDALIDSCLLYTSDAADE